ncbi:thioester reductase domain-containing protein [Amycolatopsis kentuckyensis]|uniref:thioester reductase domain-containing protein n=1 Tax=Amycolatopsis kentuckyensis TaxID=218823 RepID=UPI000A39F98B|nr:thioester reductase domain-containing protein [Amycolatopsis kentuckyensis]
MSTASGLDRGPVASRSREDVVRRALIELKTAKAEVAELRRRQHEPIAVVGAGCRFPGGTGVPDFWELLGEGRSGVGEIPAGRWDVDGLFSPVVGLPGRIYTRHGGFVDGVGSFDGGLFGVSPREAASMDPQQGLVLEVAWEALESANIAPDSLRGSRTGVFMGAGGSDFERLGIGGGMGVVDGYAATGCAGNFIANRLSFQLGLLGPSMAVDSACSSSLVALHLAVQSLRNDECDIALVGGVNLLLSPDVWVALCGARMLSPQGACRTFDATADGYVRGEGCGVVVLKRQSDVTDHDTVLAAVRGTAVNQDGNSAGITVPNPAAQQQVIRRALEVAGIDPADVGYVEAHGTGTPLGDPIELRALANVLGENRPADRPVLVGSVKTNIGHLEAAAGIAGLIKTILTVHTGLIPPHLNLKQPNPAVTWDELPVRVATHRTEWPDERRVAGVSSFGFGGTNAHAVIENWPERPAPPVAAPAAPVVVKVSGSGVAALRAGAGRLAGFVGAHRDLDPAEVAWAMGVGRADLDHRAAVVAETTDELIAGLNAVADDAGRLAARGKRGAPRVVFAVDGADSPDPAAAYGAAVALGGWWRSVGVEPHVISGTGRGAFAAAALAGVFPVEDGAKLAAATAAEFPAVLARIRLTRPGTDLVLDGRAATAAATAEFWLDRRSGARPAAGTPAEVVIALGTARPYRSLLTELAGVWTRGVDVRWDKVNPPRPRSADFPTYPFQRRAYWTPGATAPKPVREPLRPRFVLPATGGAIAETELSLRTTPFLDEHRVYGRLVVPGVVLVELLLQAGERLLGSAPVAEDVVLSRPVVLADDELRRIQVVVDPVADGRATARVFGEDASGEWHVHVRADLVAADSAVRSAVDVPPAGLSGAAELDHDGFYEQAWHPSFHLGPSFRLVRTARRGPGVCEGTLVAPDTATAGVRAGVRADLLLLDACVQLVGVAAATGPDRDRHVRLGTGYDRIVVHRPAAAGTFRCRAVTRTAPDRTVIGDLVLTDERGDPVAELSGVRFAEIPAPALERLLAPGRGAAVVPGPDLGALRSASKEERARQVCEHLVRLAAAILRTGRDEIDEHAPLSMFFDSLMLAEFSTAVERDLKVPLALESLFTDSGLASLAELVATEIETAAGTSTGTSAGPATSGPAPRAGKPAGPAALRARLQPMTVAEMARRAELEPSITAHEPPAPAGSAPEGVLLTGATGFVGAFVLAELLARRPGPVHCLVRAEDEAHALRRVLDNLDRYGLDAGAHRSRIRPVPGDLTKPLLGLDERTFAGLHELAGEIVHCGAQVKWTYPYRNLEAANVGGTREILRLATVGAPRPVHYASTVGVFSSREYAADVVDETVDLTASGSLVVGYAQSKWVAERLVRTAGERGVPVTVHRINTGGHSTTGAFNRLDHLSMMVKGCVEAGIAPEHVEMPVQPAPVDYVAAAMAEATTRPDLRGRTFHLVNPAEMSWPEFFDAVEEYGYRLTRLPFEQWRSRIVGSRSGTMALLGLIPFLNDAVDDVRLPRSESAATRAALRVTCPPLDTGLVHTYLDAYVRSGFVDPPTRR